MTTLAICNHKGGTGKTTTVAHTAAALGLSGYRTLVIDLDPQGFLTRYLGIDEPPVQASSLMLFDHQVKLRDVPVQRLKNFDVLPASGSMTKILRKLNRPTDVFWAKEALETGIEYDLVVFDTAAAVTAYSLNALVASRYALIPVTPEYQPVYGAEQTFQTIRQVRDKLNPDLQPPFFLFTQVDGRKRSHHQFRRYLRNRYGDLVLRSIIRTSTALAQAHDDGTTAFEHDPYSRGVRDYANATDEVLRHIKAGKQRAAPEISAVEPPPPEYGDGSRQAASPERPEWL